MKLSFNTWSLRGRLLLATVTVAAIGIGASDFAANTALRSYLIKQVDTQLINITDSSISRVDRAGIDDSQAQSDDSQTFRPVRPLRNVPTSTMVTLLDLKGNTVGTLGGDMSMAMMDGLPSFSNLTSTQVAATKGQPFTIRGKNDLPDIRAIAKVLPSGLGSVVVSTSLADVESTQNKLQGFFLLITLIVLLFIGLLARWIIRISLRPLREVEHTAAAIADGDYSARLPKIDESTEVGRLSASLNTMLGRIEESFAARVASESRLRRFVADASHELRTPLTTIKLAGDMIFAGRDTLTPPVKRSAELMHDQIERFETLLNDLLEISRYDAGTVRLDLEPTSMVALVQEVVASLSSIALERGSTLELVTPGGHNEVLVDPRRIRRIVTNLVANAIEHGEGKPITIEIDSNVDTVSVVVDDQGIGMTRDQAAQVFERFYRADPARPRTIGGTGLGLSISYEDARIHNGKLEVWAEPDQGARFMLTVPRKPSLRWKVSALSVERSEVFDA